MVPRHRAASSLHTIMAAATIGRVRRFHGRGLGMIVSAKKEIEFLRRSFARVRCSTSGRGAGTSARVFASHNGAGMIAP
jgi:hypothetical protein